MVMRILEKRVRNTRTKKLTKKLRIIDNSVQKKINIERGTYKSCIKITISQALQ